MRLSNFRENDNVLLLGEGNFSFAVSLVKHNLPIAITASCYETTVIHDITRNNIDFLRIHGIRVFLGVDATKISDHPFLSTEIYDKIIFNFPHVGGKMRLDKNRELLQKFFVCAENFLKHDGTIMMNLCNGQGGTLADQPKRRWDDSWKVKEMAAHGNFIISRVEPFVTKHFVDYASTGYRGTDKEFNVANSLTHFFKKVQAPSIEHFAPKIRLNLSELKNAEERLRYVDILPDDRGNFSNYCPPFYEFDITFFIAKDFREFNLYAVLYNFVGKIVRDVEFIRSYRFNDDKVTKTYRICYQSDDLPLYRRRIVDIHRCVVAKILEDNVNVIVHG